MLEPVRIASTLLALVLFAGASVACGGSGRAAQRPAAPGEATVFVAPGGDDGGSCTRASPCRTLNRAYRAAAPGEVVEVAGGTYPGQTIVVDRSKTSPDDVVIRPARGATVRLAGRLQLGTFKGDGPKHLTIRDLRSVPYDGTTPTGWQAGEGTEDVTWVNLDASNFYLRGVKDFHIVGGDWGPCTVPTPVQDACNNNKIDEAEPPYANDGITIDRARFHDLGCPGHDCASTGVDVHFECLFIAGGRNIAVRGSTFTDCEFYDIFVTRIAKTRAGAFDGLVIERNRLDTPWDGRGKQNRGGAIAFKPNGARRPFANVAVRRNSSPAGISLNDDSDGATYERFRVEANLFGEGGPCYRSVTYANNLWPGGHACRGDRRRPPFGYELRPNGNLVRAPAAAVVRRLFALAAAHGATAATVARTARRLRLAGPRGRTWDAGTVRAVLGERAYKGGVWGAEGAHPALVTAKAWAAVQRRLKSAG